MRGTKYALVRMHIDIASALALRKKIVAIYFDVEEARDTTWRYEILRQLHKEKLRGSLALFVENFLRYR